MKDYEQLAKQIRNGNAGYKVLFRIPASESYPWGEEVGFVECENWLFAVDFLCSGSPNPRYAVEPESEGYFPAGTEWMITNNEAINYGLERTSEE
jgi:hypothetical protein